MLDLSSSVNLFRHSRHWYLWTHPHSVPIRRGFLPAFLVCFDPHLGHCVFFSHEIPYITERSAPRFHTHHKNRHAQCLPHDPLRHRLFHQVCSCCHIPGSEGPNNCQVHSSRGVLPLHGRHDSLCCRCLYLPCPHGILCL